MSDRDAWPTDVLVVDDEPLARAVLRELLLAECGIMGVREARNGAEAVEAIQRRRPDLVLLDVQMPKLDGFDVIEAIGVDLMPAVVFVTAFDRHAVRAFEVHAVDYLLKPVDPVRLRDAIDHARSLQGNGESNLLHDSLHAALQMIREAREQRDGGRPEIADDRIAVRDAGRVYFVRPDEILWLESQGNYVTLHLRAQTLRHRATVEQMAALLGPAFIRIRRSTLVRARAVRMCEAEGKGSHVLTLEDGTRLMSSRFYRRHLGALLDR